MASNETQLRTPGRRARWVFAALLALAGSSLSLATAPRVTLETGARVLPAAGPPFQQIYCASDNMKRNFCSVNTRGGVRLVRQRSGSACIQGQTWGYNRNAIWVDRGCRADFSTRY